ncbi:hypothetical protein CVT25_008870 [Psilocybe cyanescens]|uniref:G-protein coupled receptors family 1 profile domain-containing protein n=1 Tax=Psilocybe cyanescens TaxID=93625 RepID=A0A409VRC7_PSICY|nr:hypothetical protein CVT25_008870 [Psilocybe cyanescens]
MHFAFQPDPQKSVQFAHISSALSIFSYAIVLVLFVSSLYLLIRSPADDGRARHRFLLAFTITIFSISTIALVSTLLLNFLYPTANFLSFSVASINKNLCTVCWCSPIRQLENVCVTAAIWAADGFMLWRCITLYQGMSRPRQILLSLFCSIMGMVSFAIGLVYTVPLKRTDLSLTLFSSITLLINVATTGLIVGRLLYYQYFLQQAFGPTHKSPYMRIVALFFESAALIVAFNIALLVLVLVHSENDTSSLILLQMMVQIYAISPLMIIFKVAYDRAYRPDTSSFKTRDAQGVVDRDLQSLQFLTSVSPNSAV